VHAGTLAAARLHVALPNFRVLFGIRPPANASGTGPKLDALAELEGEMLQYEKGGCVNMCAYRERKTSMRHGRRGEPAAEKHAGCSERKRAIS